MSEINRIGSATSGPSVESLRQSLGLGASGPARPTAAAIGGRADPGAIGGPRGNRILPADFPLDQLDRRAARGTYLDILV
jgi:hypothetical protein